LGYGLEYSYSVMERIRMAALAQGDDKLQLPLINNLGNEVWKCKEAKQPADEAPTLGDPEKRGILMEAVGAVAYLMSGSDILMMRHPEAVRLAKSFIDLTVDGGSAADVAPIHKLLAQAQVDLLGLAPEPNLTIEAEKEKPQKAAAPEKPVPPKVEKKPEPAVEAKKVEVKAKAPEEAKVKPEAVRVETDAAAKAKAEAEEKSKSEAEAKAKAEAEGKARKEAEAKVKAEAEAKKAAEAKAKAEAEAEKAAEAKAKVEAELEKIRAQRAKERGDRAVQRTAPAGKEVKVTPAAVQKTTIEKMIANLDWIHRRNR
jgi:acetyl-CoA decarbonylase/synthase complex subunit delta